MTQNLPALQQKALTVRDYLFSKDTKQKLQAALPKWLSLDRLLRVTYTAILRNPKLLDCTRESLLGSVMQCAQLGLEPVLNRAHLVPYRNTKKQGSPLECQFQVGYAGFVDLGRRSGDISNVSAHVVYENDDFDFEYGTEERVRHKPCMTDDRGEPVGVYAIWFYKDGSKSPHFYPLGDCYKYHRDRSQSYRSAMKYKNDNSPWITDEPIMLRKTAVKASSKLQSLSIEYMQAVELDNQADMGLPQRGLFLDATSPLGLPGDEEPVGFDSTIPEGTDLKALEKFLGICAKQSNRTSDELKAEAAKDPDFWKHFQKWQATNPPESTPEGTKENAEATLFEELTSIPLDTFDKLRTVGVKQFANNYRDKMPTWPENIQKIIRAKFNNPKHPEWINLLLPVQPAESTGPDLAAKFIVCPDGGPNEGEDRDPTHCKTHCEFAVGCDALEAWRIKHGNAVG
jgi:recombination protein RecT